jgi:integrase/recombinase XerD
MKDQLRERMIGPLADYADGFRAQLSSNGYRQDGIARQLQLMADLSSRLAARGAKPSELASDAFVDELLGARRAAGFEVLVSRRALTALLAYLVDAELVPTIAAMASSPNEVLIEKYRLYLLDERGFTKNSVVDYLDVARLFFSECGKLDGEADLPHLTAEQLIDFVVEQCRLRRIGSAKALVTRLRSLLRFLFVAEVTTQQLAGAVPTPSGFSGGTLPRSPDDESVAALLAHCDRTRVAGRRDFAILTMLVRLCLRACEVAALELDDLDWRRGEVVVRGKGGRRERLPLPSDVGEALVAYLSDGRPQMACRAVFLKVNAPIGALSPDGIGDLVRHACVRAGVAPFGPHRLRHHGATMMLQRGATLAEVGQALRHVRVATTAIYAKVDRVALGKLAQPWPGDLS